MKNFSLNKPPETIVVFSETTSILTASGDA